MLFSVEKTRAKHCYGAVLISENLQTVMNLWRAKAQGWRTSSCGWLFQASGGSAGAGGFEGAQLQDLNLKIYIA